MRELFGAVSAFSFFASLRVLTRMFPVRRIVRTSLAQQKVQKHETVLLCPICLPCTRGNSLYCPAVDSQQASAQSALELNGRELEPNMALSVAISNPERRKERTDQDANEREIYVAGLSKFTTKVDLEKLFATVSKPIPLHSPLTLLTGR